MTLQPETIHCSSLDEKIQDLVDAGYRLEMIKPADDPREALLSRGDESVQLYANPQSQIRNPKSKGRAGMEYRDLVPDRHGGLLIASHIRIASGGEVPDYVHFHHVLFQIIFCKSGWIRVVYEDQGPPFVIEPGDLILQPPGIRHRVLEASEGAEVIEITSPSEHETFVDHELSLPTLTVDIDRDFSGQRFVHDLAGEAVWIDDGDFRYRETSIAAATADRAAVRFIRMKPNVTYGPETSGVTVVVLLDGSIRINDEADQNSHDCVVVTPDRPTKIVAATDVELMEISLSAELVHFFFATSVPTDREP